jgi:hypothetical protein
VETYLIIGRNAVIILASITVFAGFFVALSTFLVRNTAEEYAEH